MRWNLFFLITILFSSFAFATIELNNPEIFIEGKYVDLENKLYSSVYTDQKIDIKFSVRNRFKESDQIDFQSMVTTLNFNDLTKTISTFVDLNERKDFAIQLEIPDDMQRGFYNSSLSFVITYLNGTLENATIPFQIRIRTYENKIKLINSQIIPDSACRNHELKFTVENVGKQNESDVKIELSDIDVIDALYLKKILIGDSYSGSLYFTDKFADLKLRVYDQYGNEFDEVQLNVDIDCNITADQNPQPTNDINLPRTNFEQELNKVQEQLEIEKYKQEILLQNFEAEEVDNTAQEQFVFVSIVAVFATIVLFLIFFRVSPGRRS